MEIIALSALPLGQVGRVKMLKLTGLMKRHLLDLGLIPETRVEVVQRSPSGDPRAYYIRGAVIALRLEQASQVMVEPTENRGEDLWD